VSKNKDIAKGHEQAGRLSGALLLFAIVSAR